MSVTVEKVIKLTWRDKTIEITEVEAKELRDALLHVVPLPEPSSKQPIKLKSSPSKGGRWEVGFSSIGNQVYARGRHTILVARVNSFLKGLHPGTEYTMRDFEELSGSKAAAIKIASILHQEGHLVRRREGLKYLYRLKEHKTYVPKEGESRLQVIPEQPDLEALKKAEQLEREARRER